MNFSTKYGVIEDQPNEYCEETSRVDVEVSRNEDNDVSLHETPVTLVTRPCYHMIYLLGALYPTGQSRWIIISKIYYFAVIFIWLGCIAAIIGLSHIHSHRFVWSEVLNSIGTVFDFCFPLVSIRYYAWKGNFDNLITEVSSTNTRVTYKVKRLSRLYTFICTMVWLSAVSFFYVHWRPFFSMTWHHAVYIVVLFYTMGWWAAWLSMYGFVCHIHYYQLHLFEDYMSERYEECSDDGGDETKVFNDLMLKFRKEEHSLKRTQKDFSTMISFVVGYHIVDMALYSIAYWDGSFGKTYPIWQYYGTIFFDSISIFIKLFPAALVSQKLHSVMVHSGEYCTPSTGSIDCNQTICKERIAFYQYLFMRDYDAGLCILGVKITMKLTVAIFVTLSTAAAALLRILMRGKLPF